MSTSSSPSSPPPAPGPPTRLTRAEAKARTRQLLLDSARDVFTEKGYAAATVEEIADRAGFTRGAFYGNFADKGEALWEVVDAHNQAEFDELVAALDAAELAEKLEVLQGWFDRLMQARPLDRALGEMLADVGQSDDGRRRLAALFAQSRRTIAHTLEVTAEVLGVSPPVPIEHLAAMALAVGNGLGQQHLVDPEAVPSSLFADAQAYLWFGAFAGAESADFTPRTGTTPPPRRRPARRRS